MEQKEGKAVKCEVIIDPSQEEKCVICAKAQSPLVDAIRALAEEKSSDLFGYRDREIVKLDLSEICCFSVVDNRVCAMGDGVVYQVKERLYALEERLPKEFVKINQSCLGNINKMERFDTSVSGTLKIRFQNGYVDYVSRRQLKTVKERLGI